ncbi:MAG: NADP-dependent isocitrate dehydrogenase [Deltaproteobacteria bacterium]|nr:NADP-dependent isocitrate dehydrogenase [Deltaproteobacteria bacterium]
MGKYLKLSPPKRGSKITVAKNGQLQVPDDPIVPFIQGDGITAELWRPIQEVLDIAVDRCYANAKRLEWLEVFAGDRGNEVYGTNNRLPEDTIRAVQEYKVCIKGPLTPTNNAALCLDTLLREHLDLFAHVQNIRYLDGAHSALKFPHGLDIVVFREHTEDVYSDVEWKKGSPEAKQLLTVLNEDLAKKLGKSVRPDSSVGIKPISATATKRLIRLALEYAIKHKRKSVTFAHNGALMRHTEGFFRDWGYELTRKEFGEYTVTEQDVTEVHGGTPPRGRIIVKDRSTDVLMQELLLTPEDHDVIAATNLNGHYLQAVATASVGGMGLIPNAHLGAKAAVFEATHGLLPQPEAKADQNPTAVLLCGVMLFDHLGWKDSAELITHALIKTISDGKVTPDLARNREDVQTVSAREFCEAIVENFEEVRKSRVRQAMKRVASNMP